MHKTQRKVGRNWRLILVVHFASEEETDSPLFTVMNERLSNFYTHLKPNILKNWGIIGNFHKGNEGTNKV